MTPRHVLVIGAQRCGTTLLYELLDAHPQITMARPRRPEPKVFLSAELAGRGIEWYHSTYFGHATDEVVYGEKSTSYLEDADAAVRARAMLGTPTIVVQLRDPIARAVSNWRFSTEHGVEDLTLEQALDASLRGDRTWDSSRFSVSPFAYLERGRYIDYLTPWVELFPASVQVLFLEDDPLAPAQRERLFTSLGVEPHLDWQPDERVNASGGEPPQLSASLVADLRAYYLEADTRLSALVNRPLPWAPTPE